jgi:hypothetical protein
MEVIMKRISLVFLLFFFSLAIVSAQEAGEEAPNPNVGFSLVFTDSIAFAGLGVELYLGNIGLGGTFTTFFFGYEGNNLYFPEPGVYVRYYFFGPQASMYIGLCATYITLVAQSKTDFQGIEAGLLNTDLAVGFNAFFGSKKNFRFAIEVGPRYVKGVQKSEVISDSGFLFFHFLLQFGMNI